MSYISDIKDKEWKLIQDYFKRKDPRGRKEKHSKRTILNAILYVVKGGIQWNMLPKDFPPYKTVYDYFSIWNKSGLWDKILTDLNRKVREKLARKPQPSYGIIDSQSVKNVYSNEEQGFDGNKKNKGTQTTHSC